jgi:hypothetical protein
MEYKKDEINGACSMGETFKILMGKPDDTEAT